MKRCSCEGDLPSSPQRSRAAARADAASIGLVDGSGCSDRATKVGKVCDDSMRGRRWVEA